MYAHCIRFVKKKSMIKSALIVPVDDEIKGIAALGRHGDELLACAESGADVVHERQVAVRGQGCGTSGSGVILQQQLRQSRHIRIASAVFCRRVHDVKVLAVYKMGIRDRPMTA